MKNFLNLLFSFNVEKRKNFIFTNTKQKFQQFGVKTSLATTLN